MKEYQGLSCYDQLIESDTRFYFERKQIKYGADFTTKKGSSFNTFHSISIVIV